MSVPTLTDTCPGNCPSPSRRTLYTLRPATAVWRCRTSTTTTAAAPVLRHQPQRPPRTASTPPPPLQTTCDATFQEACTPNNLRNFLDARWLGGHAVRKPRDSERSCLLLLCLVALSSCAPSPKRRGVDVEKTVAQVEEVLRQNANLPRLSREDIMQLLNDIRAEDERSASASAERATSFEPTSKEGLSDERQANSESSKEKTKGDREREQIELNEISNEIDLNPTPDLIPPGTSQGTTLRPTPRPDSLMVVLPYTPRDGTSLQELYTRPPRVALVRAPAPMRHAYEQFADGAREESKVSPTILDSIQSLTKIDAAVNTELKDPKEQHKVTDSQTNTETVITLDQAVENISSPNIQTKAERINSSAGSVQIPVEYPDVSSELREFLQLHGLHGNAGAPEDHFLLPLDGFKPLPPVRQVDGSVELPESILLTYDLISPHSGEFYSAASFPSVESVDLPPETYVYDPLRPEVPFELDALSSETKKTVVALNAPSRKRKAAEALNYSPIEYDSVKVIPLKTGPDPLSFDPEEAELDVQKRQSENATTTTESPTSETPAEETTTAASEEVATTTLAPARDSSGADSAGSGPSIADLESSFGAPAPEDESESMLPPPRKNGFYWMLDWNSFLEVGDGDEKVNIRFEPKLGDPQMFLPVSVP